MKLIKNFEINTNDLSALQESRSFKVSGDDSAVFSLQVKTSTGKFYNFKSKLFETTITSEHRLVNQTIIGKSYSGEILFPADADGETYTILLLAEPHFNTEITSSLTGNVGGVSLEHNPVLYRVDITQVADVVVTFQPISASSAVYSSATRAQTTTVTQSPTVDSPATATVSWTIANDGSDSVGYGLVALEYEFHQLKLVSSDADDGYVTEIDNGHWYVSTTAVIDDTKSDDGGGSSHFDYAVDSINDLEIGMTITAISSGTLGGLPTLTRVYTVRADATNYPSNRNKPGIKLSTGKVFANGITLTLKGYGIGAISKAKECDITLSNFKLTQTPLTTTVRGAISASQSVTVNGTYGISAKAYIEGFGVNNAVSNPLTGVTIDEDEGTLTTTTVQTLADNTTLNIIGSSNSYTVTGDITVNKMPASATTIYLDLDKLLIVGTAS